MRVVAMPLVYGARVPSADELAWLLIAAAAGGWWTMVGAALVTFLLARVSGVTRLEKKLTDTRPEGRPLRIGATAPRIMRGRYEDRCFHSFCDLEAGGKVLGSHRETTR